VVGRERGRERPSAPCADRSGSTPFRRAARAGSNGYAGEKPFSEATAEAIDAEVLRIISESHEEAKRLLSAHRKQLDALAGALLSRETLNEREILQVTGLPPAPPLETAILRVASKAS